ncbi:hypothetical protein ESCO_005109 [Escovopsis weberi]|uniref:Extracellular membrane protein CFEM domain-containing protein n=1 Tax=Escovopsis weberi TaxID=150374 RepID=A0A0M9VVZ0_ESCWE|nr:hypothetical protein ESCO_005109 [Escovopsis weberi]
MRFSVVLASIFVSAGSLVAADCFNSCVISVANCCNHVNSWCDKLARCGANSRTDACSNVTGVCNDYCGNSGIAGCIANPAS